MINIIKEQKMKMFYLSATYLLTKTGGGLVRNSQVKYFRDNGINVTVVTINHGSKKTEILDDIIKIPNIYSLKYSIILERLGIFEDYLDLWIKKAYKILIKIITTEDIVFSASGGDFGMLKLGALLKKKLNCKFIIKLHDPLAYTLVNGLKLNSTFHVSREKSEKRFLEASDLIITTSGLLRDSLQQKYQHFKNRIINNYSGYIGDFKLKLNSKKKNDKIRFLYCGNFGKLQSPEIFGEIFQGVSGIECYFIGNYKSNKGMMNYSDNKRFVFKEFMPHKEFEAFCLENIDIGLVSLRSEYLAVCVPSKIYEYISLGLPVMGLLPAGDALDIINNKKYGLAFHYNDIKGFKAGIEKMKIKKNLESFRKNVIKDREKWGMRKLIKNDLNLIKSILNS